MIHLTLSLNGFIYIRNNRYIVHVDLQNVILTIDAIHIEKIPKSESSNLNVNFVTICEDIEK